MIGIDIQRNLSFLHEINKAIGVAADESAYLIRQQAPLKRNGTSRLYGSYDIFDHTHYVLPVPSQSITLDGYDGITVRGTSITTRRTNASSLHTVTVGVHNPAMDRIPIWEYGIRSDGKATLESYSVPPSVNMPLRFKGTKLLLDIKRCAVEGLLVARLVNSGLEAQGIHVSSVANINRLQEVGNEKFGLGKVKLIYGMRAITPQGNR